MDRFFQNSCRVFNKIHRREKAEATHIILVPLTVDGGRETVPTTMKIKLSKLVPGRSSKKARRRLYEHLLRQEMGFFDAQKSGDLVSRLGSDTLLLQQATIER